MDVYANRNLGLRDGPAELGPNLIVQLPTFDEDGGVTYEQLFPREVEELRDVLTEWLRAVSREQGPEPPIQGQLNIEEAA